MKENMDLKEKPVNSEITEKTTNIKTSEISRGNC
jgi:hypothetical protein